MWLTVVGLFGLVVAYVLLDSSSRRTTTTQPQSLASYQQTPTAVALVDLSTNPDVLRHVTVVSSVFAHRTLADDNRTWNISVSSVRVRNDSGFTLQGVTLECSPQPVRRFLMFTTPLESGYSEELSVQMLACRRGSSFRVTSVSNNGSRNTLLVSPTEAEAVKTRHAQAKTANPQPDQKP
jgi:hypothetical protein